MAADANQLAEQQSAMKARQMADRNKRRVETRRRNREMEASVTTVNITGTNGEETAEVLYTPETAPVEETVTVSVSQLAALQAQLDELREAKQVTGMFGSREELAYFIQEMKKPDAETQAKIEEEKARKKRERDEMIGLALEEEQQRINRQANCRHLKENNRTAFVFANEKNGVFMYLCQHCQKVTESTLSPDRYGVRTDSGFVFA